MVVVTTFPRSQRRSSSESRGVPVRFANSLSQDYINLDDHISQTSIYVHLAKLTEPTLYIKTCLYTCGIIHYISTGGCRGTLRLTVSFQDLEKTLRLKGI